MSVACTAVIARRISSGREQDFEEWLERLVNALRHTAGYDGMTALTSSDARGSVRTLVIRFHSAETLADWERSPLRHRLVDQADRFSTAQYQTATGMETLFAVPGVLLPPPRWKMCLLTMPTVYVLVNIVLFAFPHSIPVMREWPLELRMVPVICIMTLLLTYVCLPILSRGFSSWLFPHAARPVTHTFQPPYT